MKKIMAFFLMTYFLLYGLTWATETVLSSAGQALGLENSGGSARAKAMGSAFVGVADDSSALLWNPAGLGRLTLSEIGLHHNSWLVDTVQETLVYGMPLGEWGGAAAAVNYINYGSFESRDSAGVLGSSYTVSMVGFSAGWGKEFGGHISGGISLKGLQQTIASQSFTGFGADIGALWSPDKAWKAGLSYTNLGGTFGGSSLASSLRLGGSYATEELKDNKLILAVGAQLETQGTTRIDLGAEDVLFATLAVRAGYELSTTDPLLGGLSGLTLGAGYLAQHFSIDYAYLPYGDLGTSHRLSVAYQFGGSTVPTPSTK